MNNKEFTPEYHRAVKVRYDAYKIFHRLCDSYRRGLISEQEHVIGSRIHSSAEFVYDCATIIRYGHPTTEQLDYIKEIEKYSEAAQLCTRHHLNHINKFISDAQFEVEYEKFNLATDEFDEATEVYELLKKN